jgi:RNA polymerase sigma-70 factor (ECF subfamily)
MSRDRSSLLRGPSELPATAAKSDAELDVSAVYATHRELVWMTLQRMGVRRADLEDVFQDVFMVVHRRLDSYRPEAKLSAWLYGICLRCVARHRRRAFRRRERADGLGLDAQAGPLTAWHAAEVAPDQRLEDLDGQAKLNRLLDTLDPEHRSIVVMYEIEELSCARISQLTGVPVGTIHSRLHHARRKLTEAARRLGSKGRS